MVKFAVNHLSFILCAIASISIITVFVRQFYSEKKSFEFTFIVVILANIGIWGGYLNQKYSYFKIDEMKSKNEDSARRLADFKSQNTRLQKQLKRSLATISNLNETIATEEKKRKIESLQNLLSEIEQNFVSLKTELIINKDIFLDPDVKQSPLFRFKTDVITSVISGPAIDDKSLLKHLVYLKDGFETSNRMLDSISSQKNAAQRILDWNAFFDNFDGNQLARIDNIYSMFEDYIMKLETE